MSTPQLLDDRVNYAARIIREGRPTSRRFDSCFEMGDGDAVVLALVKRAKKSPGLSTNLSKYVAATSIEAAEAKLKE